MNKADKSVAIDELVAKFEEYNFFYVTDSSSMTVAQMNKFRRLCYEQNIEFKVLKNSLIKKAFERLDNTDKLMAIAPALKGTTAVMFSDTNNGAAKVLKTFRTGTVVKPALKAAYIDSDVYFGDDQIDMLTQLKSKNELIGEVLGLLQSPARNVISALQSGGSTIAGLLKTLEERQPA